MICLILTTLISGLLSYLGKDWHTRFVIITFALGFLIWMQGIILAWDFGVWDGREINWAKYRLYGLIDFIVWTLILGLTYYKREWLYQFVKIASVFLIVIQGGNLAYNIASTSDDSNWKSYQVEEEGIFKFANQQNVFVMVLDAFQTDVFQEIINDKVDYSKALDGFTFYRNNLAGYPFSDLSIPLILTGQYYDNALSFKDYKRQAFLSSESILANLKAKGFDVRVYPALKKSLYFDEVLEKNISKNSTLFNIARLRDLYKIVFFNYMPTFVKQKFYSADHWQFASADQYGDILAFVHKLEYASVSQGNSHAFRFYHIMSPHWPLNVNERLEREKMEVNRENYKRQAMATLEMTKLFINKLKSLGIYDNSLIVIAGDHGAGNQGQTFIIQSGMKKEGFTPVNNSTMAAALPLLLIKPFNASGDLRISDLPVSLSDIPATVLGELDIPIKTKGMVITRTKDIDRNRRFLTYGRIDYPYYGPMTEYRVNGIAWFQESWYPTFKMFTSKGIRDISPVPIKFDKTIYFGTEQDEGNLYGIFGWSSPEKSFTRTNGKTASWSFPLPEGKSDIVMKIKLQPFLVPGKLERQRMKVSIEGKEVYKLILTKTGVQDVEINIPRTLIKNPMLNIVISLPDAVSPDQHGLGNDGRQLGIAVWSVIFSKV